MPLLDLSIIAGIILEAGIDVAKKRLNRQEAIISVLNRLNIESAPAPNDFESIYAYTLVEYGLDKPEPVLNFFRYKIIVKAFRRALYENNMAILDKEAEGIIDWNKETGLLGAIDYDPRLEFASFTAVFNRIVDNLRSPSEVKRDQLLKDVHVGVEKLLANLTSDATLTVAKETAQPAQSQKLIRWLHLSDFHIGKDGYGERQVFKYILEHVKDRVILGSAPDFVFITGDIANKGADKEYKNFYDQFFLPLLECLPMESQERIFIVPGNHDVDRSQSRAVQTKDVLLRVTELLDPDELGQFERQSVFPRFKEFVDNDLTNLGEHWLNSVKGVSLKTLDVRGVRLGIVGVNTAWLSSGDDDRHNLSMGKNLLENGLEAIKDCDIKIVLGHHPLDWLLDTEINPVRTILGKHAALYLHGHMHKGRIKHEDGGGYSFLAMQSGASFQARENEVWVNRFLWCELDLTACKVCVEPLQWSKSNQSWVIDGDAFQPQYQQGDRWILPLPFPASLQLIAGPKPPAHKSKLEIPDGWNLVDAQYLKDRSKELSSDQAISFFDGRVPIWREALAPQIPRREIVGKLVADLESARREGGLRITLLTGAAGEGKTTALLQVVSDLVNVSSDWRVVWRHDSTAPFPAELVSRLPDEGTWLIVSDDAEVVARRVFDSVQALKLSDKKNVQFLLCCRDTDWKAADVEQLPWGQQSVFVTETLRGISKSDAQKIVSAWELFGKKGMKGLDGLQFDAAVAQLLAAAKSEEANSGEGSFFGAVLQVRYGEGLKTHIDDLLRQFEKRPISSGKTLLDAFAYISVMHAENLQILSKEVLAEVLEIRFQEMKRKVLGPLGEEAAIATTGRMVFTRHRAIANTALRILLEKYDIDSDNLYVDLVQAASRAYLSGIYVPDIGEWNYLSDKFFENGDPSLGIRLAQSILEIEPTNPFFIVKLAQLYRKAEQPEQGAKIFRSVGQKISENQRPFYNEWGIIEGNVGNHALKVWLISFSLSDHVTRQPPDHERVKYALNTLSLTFQELFQKYSLLVFADACGALAQLWLKNYSNESSNLVKQMKIFSHEYGVDDFAGHIALDKIREGITCAWIQRERDLPDWVVPGNEITLNGFARVLRITI